METEEKVKDAEQEFLITEWEFQSISMNEKQEALINLKIGEWLNVKHKLN